MPTTDSYQILGFGALGGNASPHIPGFVISGAGGRGAEIGGAFSLTAGEVLTIAVGGAGLPGSGSFIIGGGGGGGGSFVVGPGNTPLVVAGGGGGSGIGAVGFGIVDGGGGLTSLNGGGMGGGTNGSGGCLATQTIWSVVAVGVAVAVSLVPAVPGRVMQAAAERPSPI